MGIAASAWQPTKQSNRPPKPPARRTPSPLKQPRAPSMNMEEFQQHTIEALGALESTHPDAAGTPGAHEGPVPGAHDPSGAPAIRENLEYDKAQPGRHPQ